MSSNYIDIIEIEDAKVLVQTPYREEWNPKARALGGRWDKDERGWIFPSARRQDINLLIDDVFGPKNNPPPKKTVEPVVRKTEEQIDDELRRLLESQDPGTHGD